MDRVDAKKGVEKFFVFEDSFGKEDLKKDNPAIRIRVCIALSFLVGAKILNVGVPLTFKHVLDHLNAHLPVSESGEAFFNLSSAPDTVLSVATSLLVS
uniref:Uncharacterized protein n=1 Tax=Timema douglasi TaxID=61478 RepID=A0A7R8ZDC1_TIMDO|nr:unnamed protein product [Timema douglasi]